MPRASQLESINQGCVELWGRRESDIIDLHLHYITNVGMRYVSTRENLVGPEKLIESSHKGFTSVMPITVELRLSNL